MSNMSYCRFQNTLGDLKDCRDALEEFLGGATEPLSREEFDAAKRLVEECLATVMLVEEHAPEPFNDLDDAERRIGEVIADAQRSANDYQHDLEVKS